MKVYFVSETYGKAIKEAISMAQSFMNPNEYKMEQIVIESAEELELVMEAAQKYVNRHPELLEMRTSEKVNELQKIKKL